MTMAAWLLAAPLAAAVWAGQHTVAAHEHLWGLAQRYYGDPFQWRSIAGANPQVKDPHWIFPGQVLAIPEMAAVPAAMPAPLAAPVESSAQVETAAPETLPSPPSRPASLPAGLSESMPSVSAAPDSPARGDADRDALSVEMPQGLSGQYPSLTRLQAPGGWKEDGRITEFEGREIMAGQGDLVEGKITSSIPIQAGDLFYVLRQDAPEEADAVPGALYLQRVGVIQATEVLGKGRARLRILKSGGPVELGDFISRDSL